MSKPWTQGHEINMNPSKNVRVEGIPHFEVRPTQKELDFHAKNIISHIKEEWNIKNLKENKVLFTEGTSNTLVGYRKEKNHEDMILFRLYGANTELLISRDLELENFQLLATNHLAPNLYCTFENGFCYEYQHGTPILPLQLQEENFLGKTAVLLAKIHSINPQQEYLRKYKSLEGNVFNDIEKYLDLIPKEYFETLAELKLVTYKFYFL